MASSNLAENLSINQSHRKSTNLTEPILNIRLEMAIYDPNQFTADINERIIGLGVRTNRSTRA